MNDEVADLQEQIDDTFDQQDDGQDLSDEQLAQYGTMPQPKEKSDLYNWFWKVVRLGRIPEDKSGEGLTDEAMRLSKVGNLNMQEIGTFNTSVRDCLNLANLGKIFGHKKFGDYWQSVGMITTSTSMAKKGWFMDLSISQKKVRERQRGSSSDNQKQKWRLFNRGQQQQAQV